MKEQLVRFITEHASLSVATVVLATVPILELRGALPVAVLSGMAVGKAYILAVLGNMIPIPFIIWFLEPATNFVRRWERGNRFVEWLFARTRRKGKNIEKYEWWGLMIFVAIPLPMTGAWTGALAGHLFGFTWYKTFSACFAGVCTAGVIMALLATCFRELFTKLFG